MSVPTLFARISSLVMSHSLKSVRSRSSRNLSRRQRSDNRFTQIVEEMEQRMLLSGTGGLEEESLSGYASAREVLSSEAYDPLLDPNRSISGNNPGAQNAPPFPLATTFLLNSNPSADMTIYLDFNGHVTSGTGWQSGATFTSPAYDRDGDPTTFNADEQEQIQRAWQRVVEDFAPFNVNVTTQEPDIERLRNTGGGDTQWGVRVVISGDNGAWQGGSSGGVAFLNSFDDSIDTPAFAFQLNLANGAEKFVGEVISHEVGHTLGLSHDGQGATTYYQGHGAGATGWAPIMGNGYYRDVTQWSSGEYTNSATTEDDLAIIVGGNGFTYRTDDYGSDINNGSLLTGIPGVAAPGVYTLSGIIEQTTDSDWFTFEVGTQQILTLDANPYVWGANLDILAEVYDNTGALVASSNPADALNASLTTVLNPGIYHIRIDGVGVRTVNDGYSDYASIGQYTIVAGLTNFTNTAPVVNNQVMSVNENSQTGDHVGFVVASDAENDTLVYSIVGGNVAGTFAINSVNGRITVADPSLLNFETNPSFQLTVRVTEVTGAALFDEATVTINLLDLNDPPVITPNQSFTILENSATGTSVGTVIATDEDGDTISYSIIGGNTGNAFAINASTGEITVQTPAAVDFETNPLFNLVIQVTDDGAGNVVSSETVTINLLDQPNLNFVRLNSIGSQVFADQNRQITLTGPGDEAVFDFYGQAGEILSAVLTPTNPNAIVTLEIVELSQAFSSTVPGQPLVVSGEPLPLSQSYRIRVTSSVADTLTLDTYLNATLEQQALGGDSSVFTPVAIDDSLIDFGVQRYSILGNSSFAGDSDLYTIDLTGRVGEKIEVILDGVVEDFGSATLELQDQFGTTLATASATPLGVDPTNLDLIIMEFDVPADGIYRLEVTSPTVIGEYVLTVMTESIGFEIDPNNDNSVPLRDITNLDGVTGFLSDIALNSPVLSKLGRMDLAAVMNLPPAAFTAFLPEGVSYEEFLASLAPLSNSTTYAATPLSLISVGESEPNDSIGQANLVPLGFDTGEDPNVQISGNLAQAVTVVPITTTEDNGDINRATETTIVSGQQAVISSSIGDGPFAASTGDYDFYAVRNVQVGSRISIDIDAQTVGSTLDSYIAIYDAAGNLVASNDDDGSTFDSQLLFTAATAGDYFVAVFGFGGAFMSDPFDSASGIGPASTGTYNLTIGLDTSDFDFFEVNLDAGDIFNAWNTGEGTILSLYDSAGQLLMESRQNSTGINPTASPLRNAGVAALNWVTDTTGTYYVSIGGGAGAYNLNLEVYRPELETQAPGNRQILFLDFDGATIDPGIFGGASGSATLSGLSTFLGNWGLTGADENAVIDAIIASVTESLSQDMRVLGNNGDFDSTLNNGDFDIEILNSRDDADPFGQTNVSRLIIGGTIGELGISTIGIAQSIDVGNFETEETAVVLLDLLSASAGDPNSLNQYQIANGASIIDLIGTGVGNIAAHEAGHYFGNWHTNQFNISPNIMDQGGNLDNSIGIGADRIWGTADDVDVDFGDDMFVPNEGFVGTEDTLNVVAFGLSTGNTTADPTGPRVARITPVAGISGASISTIVVEFSERITAQSATTSSNFQLINAGADGLFNTADDTTVLITPAFDGNRTVTLTIDPSFAPLAPGKYQLTIDGDQSAIRDLALNPLNSTNGGPGSDTIHQFEIAQPGIFPLDVYTVTLNAGEALFLSTSTPLDDPFGNPLNNLDPALTVRGPNGLLADSDDNSAGDGRNAQLSFVATQTGTYEIEISSVSGRGEYILNLIINHPPDVVEDTFAIPENSPVGTVVGTPAASDPDNDQITYSIVGGNPNNTFAINLSSGLITVNDSTLLDFETTPFFDLVVQVTDDGVENLTDTAIVRVNLTDINEEPTIGDQTFTIDENSPNATVVGQMNGVDVDAGDSLTYTIESGNTNGAFTIDSVTGEITVANSAALNFETTPRFDLVVRVTDTGGLFNEADATIFLRDINDQPVMNDQTFQIAENSPGGTSVGVVVATDEDNNPADQLTFVILSGNTNGAFAINSTTGEITVANPLAVNFETTPFFDLQVQVTDDGTPNLNDVATIRINVLNRPDGVMVPFFDGFESYPVVNPPGNPLPPGSPWVTNSTRLGRARVTDLYQPFEGAKHLLLESSVVDNDGSLNEVVLEVNPGASEQIFLEFAQREYLDEDDPMSAVFTGSENSDGVAFSSDGITWYRVVSLTGTTSTNQYQEFSFNLSTLAGEVGLDLTKNFFVKFQQFDNFPAESDGIAFDNIRLLSRPTVNLPPVVQDQLIYINENPLQGLVVGHVQASDPNPGDTVAYEIVSGNDTATVTGVFSIDAMTGELRVEKPGAIDFETNPVFRLGIRVTDGATPTPLSGTAVVTIQVKNVEERDALFFDNFEDGTLSKWTTASTNLGRIQVTANNGPAQGVSHLTFDSSANSPTSSLNEATFTFVGTGYKDLMLSMYQREFNDEDHPLPEMFTGSVDGDGISISVDGATWYRVDSLVGPNSTETYQQRRYDLSALALLKGLNLQQTVYVKIQAFDNFEIPFDGMAFDDVLVDGVPIGPAAPAATAQGIAGLAIEGGQLNWYVTSLNGGVANGLSQAWGTSGPASQGVLEVKTGDFNGDGRSDVALQNNGGEWWIGLSDGTLFNQLRWTRWKVSNSTFSDVVVGDFNGDGRDDLLGRAANGNWWAAEAQGNQFGNRLWGKWSATTNWQDVSVGDFNNDGLDDIAGRASSGNWWVGLSNGTQFQNLKWGKWSATTNWQDVNVGDFNGDGLTDIVGRASSGNWWAGISNGTQFQNSFWGKWSATTNWQDVNVGDFNGDGRTDITGRASAGRWWTGLSQGNAFATTAWGMWSSTGNWNDVVVGDFNADGKDDIAGRRDSGQWWNALSQGDKFLSQMGAQWDPALNWRAVNVGAYNAPAIPVTPPPVSPGAPAPAAGFGFGNGTQSSSTVADNQGAPTLVYQAKDYSNTQTGQNDSANSGQPAPITSPTVDSATSSVEELFGDQSLLDMLADLG